MVSVLWRVAKRLSYIEEARCLKVKHNIQAMFCFVNFTFLETNVKKKDILLNWQNFQNKVLIIPLTMGGKLGKLDIHFLKDVAIKELQIFVHGCTTTIFTLKS